MTQEDSNPIESFVTAERATHQQPRVKITGLMMQYYHVCERELWFMSRGIDIDREDANIRRGTHIDETSYRDKRKSFQINGRINIDILDSGDVIEVKASSTLEKPVRMQLLYYLWYLDRIVDIKRDGVLAYPSERKRESVILTDNARSEIRTSIRRIIEIVERDTAPELDKKPFCDACLYQDLCWM
ncbi:CRISPR-associated protein Cas4 [Haloquadratum walsbyi]|jgi:CRISPR-associated exonuclease Cas4|uniref:CRISPR-associated protein Cas4 n=1 Tax=Haloquadratum walsbyi TaxID=293091 RepID=UPI0023F17D30|nr:CRISPR-associated protein Cas4 [Haloquadratum walsbyi]